jgi:hypothetical protein
LGNNLGTIDEELRFELSQGERLLWSGRPRTGVVFRPTDIFEIPFSIFWTGFSVFWISVAAAGGGAFALFGVPFLVIGFYMLVGRFVIDAKQRARTLYGVTNQRVIIKSGLFSRSVKSINLRTLSDLTMTEKKNGGGTITLGPASPMSYWSGAWMYGIDLGPPRLLLEKDARHCYEIIRGAQAGETEVATQS